MKRNSEKIKKFKMTNQLLQNYFKSTLEHPFDNEFELKPILVLSPIFKLI